MTAHADVTPRPTGSNRCPGCTQAKGPSDLLCAGCWRHLPRVLVSLYRLVWQLVHAGLVDSAARAELERLLLRECREARQAAARAEAPVRVVDALRPTLPPPAPKVPAPTKPVVAKAKSWSVVAKTKSWGEIAPRIMNALPASEAEAVTVPQLVRRSGLERKQVNNWLFAARTRGHPALGVRKVGGGAKVGRYAYWRRAA